MIWDQLDMYINETGLNSENGLLVTEQYVFIIPLSSSFFSSST